MDWTFNSEPIVIIPDNAIGFVYCITNIQTNKAYIGKKKLTFKKTTQKTIVVKSTGVKKKKKIRTEVESDWKEYYGSSDALKADIELLGKDNFKREIIQYCSTLSELSYIEAKIQFVNDCLLYPDRWYNSWISVRVRRDHMIKKAK